MSLCYKSETRIWGDVSNRPRHSYLRKKNSFLRREIKSFLVTGGGLADTGDGESWGGAVSSGAKAQRW
jgi:hypothetical protein